MPQPTSDSERVVEAYARLWDNQEYENISDVVSESYVLYDPMAPEQLLGPKGEIHGPGGLESYIRAVTSAFPDMQMTLDEMVSRDDVVLTEDTFTGTHDGELFGFPPTGRNVEATEMQKYYIVNGKVETQAVYYNVEDIKSELGLTFPTVVRQGPKLVWRKVR